MTTTRRIFLGALSLAPAALAGCAGESGAARRGRAEGAPAAAAPEAPGPAPPQLAAVRDFPLPADEGPAYVFRAGTARPGGR